MRTTSFLPLMRYTEEKHGHDRHDIATPIPQLRPWKARSMVSDDGGGSNCASLTRQRISHTTHRSRASLWRRSVLGSHQGPVLGARGNVRPSAYGERVSTTEANLVIFLCTSRDGGFVCEAKSCAENGFSERFDLLSLSIVVPFALSFLLVRSLMMDVR